MRKRFEFTRYKRGSLRLDRWSQHEEKNVEGLDFFQNLTWTASETIQWTTNVNCWDSKMRDNCRDHRQYNSVNAQFWFVPFMVMFVGWNEWWDEIAVFSWVSSRQFSINESHQLSWVVEIRTEKWMRILTHKLNHVSPDLSELINSLCSGYWNARLNPPASGWVSQSILEISFSRFFGFTFKANDVLKSDGKKDDQNER
jgi:hypothetical protein